MKNEIFVMVEKMLSKYPASRDSDLELFWCVAEEIKGTAIVSLTKKEFFELPKLETLGRMRRRFQALGLYLGSEEVRKARELEEQKHKEIASADLSQPHLPELEKP